MIARNMARMIARPALALVAAFGIVVLLGATGCKPKEGGSCSNTQAVCTSKNEGLFCEKPSGGYGKYRRYACGGARGCYVDGKMTRCDQAVASVGDVCDAKDNGSACASDHKSTLKCDAIAGGVFALESQCRGPKGCEVGAKGIECDRSIAEAGDACQKKDDGTAACTADGRSRVDCIDGKYVLSAACEGPKHCADEGDAISCDAPAMHAGARCKQEGAAACAVDHKAMLHCKEGHYAEPHACLGENACELKGDDVYCDQSIAEEGMPCSTDRQDSCGTDGKTMLLCKAGKFTKVRSCPHACKLGKAAKGYVAPARCT